MFKISNLRCLTEVLEMYLYFIKYFYIILSFSLHDNCFLSPRRHTLVLGSSGQLWAFGNGVKGQIGTGRPEDSLAPTLVQLPWTTDSEASIPKGVYVWAVCSVDFKKNDVDLIFP